MNAPAAQDGLNGAARYLALAVLIANVIMTSLDGTIMNMALPAVMRVMHASAASSVWIISAYQLAALTLLLPAAAVGDRIGLRKVYLVGVTIFTVASGVCASAPDLAMLIFGRALQGAGAAGIMSCSNALIKLTYPKRLYGRGVSINAAVIAAASASGPSIAAAVLSVASWHWLFLINLPTGVFVVLLGIKALPDNAVKLEVSEPVSLLDVLLNVTMFGLILVALQSLAHGAAGEQAQISSPVAFEMLCVGVVIGVIYWRRQRSLCAPLLPIDLLRIPIFRLSMCTSVTSFVAQTAAFVALPFLFFGIWGCTPSRAGLLMACWPLTVVIVAPIVGRFIGRVPGGLPGGIGLAILAVGVALLALLPRHPGTFAIAWRMSLCGMGFGIFQSPNNHAIMTSGPAQRSGAAGGMLGTARLTGQTLGAALLILIFSILPTGDGRGPVIALALSAVMAAIAGVFSSLRLLYSPSRDGRAAPAHQHFDDVKTPQVER
jgi:DHA2 family multidrug resistance protein-like MFS transporter